MKMNSVLIPLPKGKMDYGFFKIIIASENGYEPRAFPQEGITWTMEMFWYNLVTLLPSSPLADYNLPRTTIN